ncbi:mite group 2 allergen Gly d 2.02-like [Sabethes cyaneus]|uniref:mite group 2 allergen Gly d 2.02-like n=1 Tax=Sabethes cyaneus TaxID=53552 RepID=UPI00237EC6CC|nr:mite group 2 allergen Gly d 2.02-like [Sabethes cyaneus]
MFKFHLLVFIALVPSSLLAEVYFSECPNGAPTPLLLKINDCIADECNLVAGEPLTVVASGIVSPVDSSSATAHISAFLDGLNLGFEIPPHLEDACLNGIEEGCPLAEGSAFSYSLVSDSLEAPARGVSVEIEVGLVGDGGVPLVCVRFNAVIN